MISINISDIHFGRMNPQYQYKLLSEQFIYKIKDINFDFICISGDLFDHKMYAENDAIMYASLFVNELHQMCKAKDAMLIIIKGTPSHDSDQLKLFYSQMDQWFSIVEHIGFVNHNGYRILCIPEEHGLDVSEYTKALYSDWYDMAIFHGLLKGSCYGADTPTIDTSGPPIFSLNHFRFCAGPIIGGHIHVANCFQSHMYYTGSPYRWCFGEEQEKGFIVMCMDDDTRKYMVHFEPIKSLTYTTINIDDQFTLADPKTIIENIKLYITNNHIDYIRLEVTKDTPLLGVIKEYFKNNGHVSWKTDDMEYFSTVAKVSQANDQYKEYEYMKDPKTRPVDNIALYINQRKEFNHDSELWFTGNEIIELLTKYEVTLSGTK